ncbi:LysR family transcriptional regulator [Novosphingobium rosa]|uniref:LysR family transcriptional regulator n=1 Tax=Novosphingobium rosa TaxID=76978 RepID=UPI00082CEE4A|nr:LysR family transcriptional regulator [Novosphingobium rosa]
MIDPRHLTHLLAIHEQGSLSLAGQVLNLSQPALSNSIAVLEQRLGAPVLIRNARGAVVNELGAALVRRAREIRSVLEHADQEAMLLRRGRIGPLAVGVTPSLVEQFIPDVLEVLLAELPQLSISVIEGLDGPLNEALIAGELDVVVASVGQPNASPDITEELLISDPFLMAVHENSPLIARPHLKLSETLEELWVVPRPGGSAYAHTQAMFLNAGVDWPRRTLSTNSVALTHQLVARLGAVALVNRITARGWTTPVRTIPLSEAGHRKIGLRRRRSRETSPSLQAFAEIAAQVLQKHAVKL